MRHPDICIVMNAGSGKGADKLDADRLRSLTDAHPGRFEIRTFQPGDDVQTVTAAALKEGFSTIVAAGGDGTICGVSACLRGSDVRLGVLPLGTFNYFARSFDIPEEPEAALAVIADGHTVPMRVGMVNEKQFLNNASLGAYASILATREDVYRRWGRSRLAAYYSVFLTLIQFRAPLKIRVTVDGRTLRRRSPLVFVVNNSFQLREMGLGGTECIDDGQFVMLIAPDCGRMGLIRRAISLAGHTLEPGSDFEMICGREITIETRRKNRLVARDGERDLMHNPFVFRVEDAALNVVVPRQHAQVGPEAGSADPLSVEADVGGIAGPAHA